MSQATRFNPENLWPGLGFPFHHAVVEPEGRRVHVSGQVAWDKERNIIGIGDVAVQTQYTISNIELILEPFGGTLDDIISVGIFYVDQDDYKTICETRKNAFSLSHGPASTAVRVAGLVQPELLIEVSAIAVIPHERYKEPT